MKILIIFLLLFCFHSQAAITLAVRGDSFDARYSAGDPTPAKTYIASTVDPRITAEATGLGSNTIDLSRTALSVHYLIYKNKGNVGTNLKKSFLISFSTPNTTGAKGLGGFMGFPLNHSWTLVVFLSGAEVRATVYDDVGATYNAGLYTIPGFAADTYYDIGVSYDPTLATNNLKLWVDGVNVATASTSREWTAFSDDNSGGFVLGSGFTNSFTQIKVREAVVWDNEIIDFSSVALVGGTGSLNGASRTAYVDVAAFDGSNYTDPGTANVVSTQSYIFAGSTQSGALVLDYPANADVRSTVTFNSGAGSGSLIVPATTDVRSGVTFDDGVVSGSLVVPATNQVQTGVTFDNGSVGTLDTISLEGITLDGGTRSLILESE